MAASMTLAPGRNGAVGFCSALGFLLFIMKSGERVQLEHRAWKDRGMLHMMFRILGKTLNFREVMTISKLAFMLLARTLGSFWVSDQWGMIVNSLVRLDFGRFRILVTKFAGATVLLSLLNALLKYYIALLKLEVREKVTRWCHERYLRPEAKIFYLANRVGPHTIENCDYQITSDVRKFSGVLAELFSQSLKPLADFLTYSVHLSRVQGLMTPLTLYAWYALASGVNAETSPQFGDLAADEQLLEGRFIGRHSDLISNCEQIAFLESEKPEKAVLNRQLENLLKHCRQTMDLTFNSYLVRQYLSKYFASVIALYLVSRPLRLKLHGVAPVAHDQVAQYFSSNWANMTVFGTSIQSLLELTNRVGSLSGLACRVDKLMSDLDSRPSVLAEEIEAAKQGPHSPRFLKGNMLKFEHVSLYQPTGRLLVKDLNFTVEQGQRVLVTGANSCGKSSLFRVLRKLWPLVEGTITMPAEEEIHFLPQTNFVPVGTLRDLVTYPESRKEMMSRGRSDEDVLRCLMWAHVSPAVVSSGHAQLELSLKGSPVRPVLDDVYDWRMHLTPGQKQRIAFARLFYHCPSFAILDECTNGVSSDVEHDLYYRCAKLNIAVFSISHKMELKLFHDLELHFKGDLEGSWTVSKCSEQRDKVILSSAVIKLPEFDAKGHESRITYERHVWYMD
eukprot:TRINITY_DN107552_c0_g1_i1.p1 TRINITY_DN107552_c0_g1~~TRINITY_DN107552_c0_g1_i1.p1  ORF type:complete len:675 (-),score=112.12 TRINITY_DN107552_c0_g1_i1:200-2224(-)